MNKYRVQMFVIIFLLITILYLYCFRPPPLTHIERDVVGIWYMEKKMNTRKMYFAILLLNPNRTALILSIDELYYKTFFDNWKISITTKNNKKLLYKLVLHKKGNPDNEFSFLRYSPIKRIFFFYRQKQKYVYKRFSKKQLQLLNKYLDPDDFFYFQRELEKYKNL